MTCSVEVYTTKGGEYLGTAAYLKDVRYAEVAKPDPEDKHLTTLLASNETTELLKMHDESIIYGFECYFKPIVVH